MKLNGVELRPEHERLVAAVNLASARKSERRWREAVPAEDLTLLQICALRLALEAEQLRAALKRMDHLHKLMVSKVNHGASFYDAECLFEMNGAPMQAARALAGVAEEV